MLLLSSVMTAVWAGHIPVDLTELSLEELMNIEIISASKKEEKLFEAAAAVYVITGEDIRRSGFTSIPEVLRMVPGMQVARIDGARWAISSRGFNGRFANKLLVLMDGQSVYTPIFSGVYWELQDMLLEDVERIEVIRGPGATLWGANAVNGIINIITRNAKDTQGDLVTLGVGSEERGFGGFRYGGKLRKDLYYRIYAKYLKRDDFVYASGEEAGDGWNVLRGGFRMDWEVSSSNTLTLQGDICDGNLGRTYRIIDSLDPFSVRTFGFDVKNARRNVLGRWEQGSSNDSELTLQLYYDRTDGEDAVIVGFFDTFDVDFQHRFMIREWQEIVWGFGYRLMRDETDGTFTLSLDPNSRNYDLFSAFVQDEITLIEDQLRVKLGSKFEHNDYTGFEMEPNVRVLWMPYEWHTVWGAVSRAVRTPSRIDNDMRIFIEEFPPDQLFPNIPTTLVVAFGNRDFESEQVLAFELGYRFHPTERLFLDIATFYNVYDKLRTAEPGTPFLETSPSEHIVMPFIIDNRMHGETYGGELATHWRVQDWWQLRAAYTCLQMQLHLDEDSGDMISEYAEGQSPRHQFSLFSSMNLPGKLELSLGARHIDNLPDLDIKSYTG